MTSYEERGKENDRKRGESNRWKWCVAASLAVMLLILLFMVSILNKPLIKREREIERDVAEAFLEEYHAFEADEISVEVLFREVDISKKCDRISAKVCAENDLVEVTCAYNVKYTLEKRDWILQETRLSECQYTLLASDIRQSDADARIEAHYNAGELEDLRYTWKAHWLSLEQGREAYSYLVEWQEGQTACNGRAIVWYGYDLKEGWQFWNIQQY